MTTLSTLEILHLYKTNVIKFLESLVELFPEESDLIVVRILFENQIPIEESMKKLCLKVIPSSAMIKARDAEFFIKNANNIFSGADTDRVFHWKEMWNSKRLDKADKENIFKWLDLFLGLAEMYIQNEKKKN
jgi:hypothetical protein